MKTIKLIYDKYENDIGFTYQTEEITKFNYNILEQINNKDINNDRNIKIYTWGIKKHEDIECDVIFDATLFSTKTNVDVKNLTGLDEIIQTSIMNHPQFESIMERILSEIEENNPLTIAFVCNYGKHRSVGWAELLKFLYYSNATITHIGL